MNSKGLTALDIAGANLQSMTFSIGTIFHMQPISYFWLQFLSEIIEIIKCYLDSMVFLRCF